MPGFSKEIFVDFPTNLEKYLICGICLNVFDTPVQSDCGHTFCRDCINEWIENNRNSCPECRQEFRRKRFYSMTNDENLIIISNNVFTRNLGFNSMVAELKIKCKYESNGCQQIIEFGLLSDHIKRCEHRICEYCEFTLGIDSNEHNCLQLLKTDRNDWIHKFEENEQTIENLNIEINELIVRQEDRQNLISSLMDHFKQISFDINYVLFGTYYLDDCDSISISSISICFCDSGWNKNLDIYFENFKKVMYCSHPSLPVVIIKVSSELCASIRQHYRINVTTYGWFDVDSNDPSERYIIFKLISSEKINIVIEFLSFQLSKSNPQLICQSINQNRASQMVSRGNKVAQEDI